MVVQPRGKPAHALFQGLTVNDFDLTKRRQAYGIFKAIKTELKNGEGERMNIVSYSEAARSGKNSLKKKIDSKTYPG
ncbi:hypothetical protein ES705_17575 [subsurface metagenome]